LSADCLFCRIAGGEIPAKIIHEDADVVAFRDIDPKAPTHVLVIPRRHVASAEELEDADAALLGRLVLTASAIAQSEGISSQGYRLVLNTGANGGQSVFHLHVHLLGGRRMTWPPG
jgi:histidine triad (HIT) family protein